MNWDDLHVFLTLARAGKLTAVAKQLDVSHPTVARRVKALEESIGARLFDRLPDRYVLTEAGEELLADAAGDGARRRFDPSPQRRPDRPGAGHGAHLRPRGDDRVPRRPPAAAAAQPAMRRVRAQSPTTCSPTCRGARPTC